MKNEITITKYQYGVLQRLDQPTRITFYNKLTKYLFLGVDPKFNQDYQKKIWDELFLIETKSCESSTLKKKPVVKRTPREHPKVLERIGKIYVMPYGKYKGRELTSMLSPDEYQYCCYMRDRIKADAKDNNNLPSLGNNTFYKMMYWWTQYGMAEINPLEKLISFSNASLN